MYSLGLSVLNLVVMDEDECAGEEKFKNRAVYEGMEIRSKGWAKSVFNTAGG